MNYLRNISENYLRDLLPPQIAELDSRKLLEGVLAGVQDRIQDLRSYIGNYPELINPLAGPLEVVLVTYLNEQGTTVQVPLNVNTTTPEVDSELVAWAATELGIEESTITSAVLGTDDLRHVDAGVLSLLATSLGAALYPGAEGEDPADTATRQQQIVETYFPRLRIKGTPQSFAALAKLSGFDDGAITPLWSRISARNPADPTSVVNAADFQARADILPTAVLPDEIYDPTDFTDGPFYQWTSRPLSADSASEDYYLTAVNGDSPFIQLKATGAVAHPAPGTYTLSGGASGVYAVAALDSGTTSSNLVAQAIGPGASFNDLRVVVTADTGTTRVFDVLGQLSTAKYRSSFFDAKVWIKEAGTRGVLSSPDLAANPNLVGTTATAPWRPWTGGASQAATVTLWPTRSVSYSGPVVARVQAAGTTQQVDTEALLRMGARVFDNLAEVQAATRTARYRGVGLMTSDEVNLAPYPSVVTLVDYGTVGTLSGTVFQVSRPLDPYTATFATVTSVGTTSLSTEIDDTGSVLSFAGPGVSGTFNTSLSNWQATVAGSFAGTIWARWTPTDATVIRPEPVGVPLYQRSPEGTVFMDDWALTHDDANPWVAGRLLAGGAPVNINTFEPYDGDPDPVPVADETYVADATSGIPRRLRVIDLFDEPAPQRVKIFPAETTPPLGVTFAMAGTLAGSDSELYPVVAVDRQLMGQAVWCPQRHTDLFSWWPLTEHPTDRLTVRDLTHREDVQVYGLQPSARVYDPARGWSLQLTGGGTVISDVHGRAASEYSFSFWAKPLAGTTSWAQSGVFRYGPTAVELTRSGAQLRVNLAIDGTAPATVVRSSTLNLAAGQNYIHAAILDGTATLGVSPNTVSLAGTFASAGSSATFGFIGAWQDMQVSDLSVWHVAKTADDFEHVREPHVAPAAYGSAPYVLSINDDRYTLQMLSDSGFVVPRNADHGYQPTVAPGSVVRYDSDGRYDGDSEFKVVGLGDAQIVPPTMRLGTQGPNMFATGCVVLAGTTSPIPGFNRAWSGTVAGTTYPVVSAPYGVDGGVNSTRVSISNGGTYWPGLQPDYNGTVDRVYVESLEGTVYRISIDDVGNGAQLVAAIVQREYAVAEQSITGVVKDRPSDAITAYSSDDGAISVMGDGTTVFQDILLVSTLLVTEDGLYYITTEDGDPIVMSTGILSTVPPQMYLTSKVKGQANPAYSTWTNKNSYGTSISQAALEEPGTLSFENYGVVPAGSYRLQIDGGNLGTVDGDFRGFNAEVSIVGDSNEPIIVDTILVASGIGTDPRSVDTLEFRIPNAISGSWTLNIVWSNDRDVPSQGQNRTLVIYGYVLRQVVQELYNISINPLNLQKVDTTSSTLPLASGGWVAHYNSYGTIARMDHEANLYSHSIASGEAATSPIADTLTGSSCGRLEDFQVLNPYALADSAAPAALSAATLSLSPVSAYHNVGDAIAASVTCSGGVSPLRYVWHQWSSGTIATATSATSVVIDRGGTLGVDVTVVDAIGQSSSAAGSLIVNYPPNIDLLTSSKNNAPVPYYTDLTAVISDADPADSVVTNWFSSGTLFASGLTAPNYLVNSPQTIQVVAYDGRGGTNSAELYLGTTNDRPPSVSICSLPIKPKAEYAQDLRFAAITFDPEGKPLSTLWRFWDDTTSTGALSPMTYFGGGTYCTVQKSITGETAGVKIISIEVTDPVGNVTTAGGSVEFVQNTRPIIGTFSVSAPGVAKGERLYYAASAYDPDGDVIHYEWSFPTLGLKLYGPNVHLDTATVATGSTVTARLRVYDDFGGESSVEIPQVFIAARGLAPIAITPAGGYSQTGVVATITSPDTGVEIRYTLDGSDPQSVDAGEAYRGPIMLPFQQAATTSLRARSFKTGSAPSAMAQATFLFFNPSLTS